MRHDRALITDPSMPSKARRGERHTRCIGCNQGCIGHYHAGLPIACTINPWTGFEARLPRPSAGGDGQTVVIVGAGPAGRRCGRHRPGLRAPGGGLRGRGCGRRPDASRLGAPGPQRDRARPGVDGGSLAGRLRTSRYGTRAGVDEVLAEHPDRVIVASGAGRYQARDPG
jgi:hypothetical protein